MVSAYLIINSSLKYFLFVYPMRKLTMVELHLQFAHIYLVAFCHHERQDMVRQQNHRNLENFVTLHILSQLVHDCIYNGNDACDLYQ